MGNIVADTQATDTVGRSARGQRLAMPWPLPATYGARPTAHGSTDIEWHIYAPSKWRPPQALHARMEQLLRESPETGIPMVPLHLGMWHPRLEACPRSERHEEVTTWYRCPCHKAKWRRDLQAVDPPWRLFVWGGGGSSMGPRVTHMPSRGRRGHTRLGGSSSGPCARAGSNASGGIPLVGHHSSVLRHRYVSGSTTSGECRTYTAVDQETAHRIGDQRDEAREGTRESRRYETAFPCLR